jgi:replication initiation and membrane attachment protein DnaB
MKTAQCFTKELLRVMGTWCTDSKWDRQFLAASSANRARGKVKSADYHKERRERERKKGRERERERERQTERERERWVRL